jgi:hypothetical protein
MQLGRRLNGITWQLRDPRRSILCSSTAERRKQLGAYHRNELFEVHVQNRSVVLTATDHPTKKKKVKERKPKETGREGYGRAAR